MQTASEAYINWAWVQQDEVCEAIAPMDFDAVPLLQPIGRRIRIGMLTDSGEEVNTKMRKEIRVKLDGDESRKDASAAFTLPFDTRDVWGKAKVPLRVTINGYT